MFSDILGLKMSLKWICGTFYTKGILQNKKNVCVEAKVIVKIDVVFFIVFKPDYRDLI